MNEKTSNISFEKYLQKINEALGDAGIKTTTKKEYILRVLFESKEHLSAEKILYLLKTKYNIDLGIATIYKTLTIYEDFAIVKSISIGEKNVKFYEINLYDHHDHLVCESCGKIVEFFDNVIEKLQEKIANENNFIMKNHNTIIFGLCEKCQKDI